MKPSEFVAHDALSLAELVRQKQITPLELVEIVIAQIERLNPKINSIVVKLYEFAREVAKRPVGHGPFAGVPFLLKDLGSSIAGIPTNNGSRFTAGIIRNYDSEIVTRHKNAGLIYVGKTSTPEFGLMPITEPTLFGPARNPWDLSRTTGGSSGGASAAVAAGIVPAAHAGDGGGSIRIPASCCGLFGFKPTEGRSPSGPDVGRHWFGLAVEHAVTRSVRDSAALLDVTAAPALGQAVPTALPNYSFLSQTSLDPGKLRIAVIQKPFFNGTLHPDCLDALQDAARLCESLGHHVEEASIEIETERLTKAFLMLVAAETASGIRILSELLKRKPKANELEPTTHLMRRAGEYFKAAEVPGAILTFDLTRFRIAQFFSNYDIILTPTLALPPPQIGELLPNKLADKILLSIIKRASVGPLIEIAFKVMPSNAFAFTPYTGLFNITGQPAMSVPLYWNKDGLPIGTHFAAKHSDEATLFKLAAQLEKARPWFNRRPALFQA